MTINKRWRQEATLFKLQKKTSLISEKMATLMEQCVKIFWSEISAMPHWCKVSRPYVMPVSNYLS